MDNIKHFFIGLILLFFSAISIDSLTLYNITPNIILPWVIFISIRLDFKFALSFTFFISLGYDILNPQLLGFTTMLFVVLSYLTSKYNTSFNKTIKSVVFTIFLVNVYFYLSQRLYFIIEAPNPLFLLEKTGLTILYNTIISCIIIYLLFFIDKLRFVFNE